MTSISSRIQSQISKSKAGSIYIPSDFKEFGSSAAIRKALSRLVAQGVIERIGHGIYLKPKRHKIFGKTIPNTEEVAVILAEKQGIKIVPSGAFALNSLGLSTQVTMQTTYLSNGSRRRIKLGNSHINFYPTSNRKFAMKGELSSLLLIALEELNLKQLSEEQLQRIGDLLTREDTSDLYHDLKLASSAVGDFIFKNFIAQKTGEVV
jgi:hypothetical protein